MYLKPVIIDNEILDSEPPFWIPSVFWCSALILFVLLLMILWCFMCFLRRRYIKTPETNDNGTLNSSTIHNPDNRNIKDRVQAHEVKLKLKSDAEAYQDIKEVFIRPNKASTKFNTATQTSDTLGDNVTSSPSPPTTDYVFDDATRSSSRVSSCYNCSQSIADDDMLNIFLNKSWTGDTDTNEVKFEVVGKAKRLQIDENATEIDDKSTASTEKQPEGKEDEISTISIPVRHSGRLKSEVFIMINADSTSQIVNGSDDVFK